MHAAGQPRLLDACQNAGMGAAAPRRQNDMVDTAAFSLCLRNQLGECVTIGEAAKGVRATEREEIRALPLACQSRQRRRDHRSAVLFRRQDTKLCAEDLVEQHIPIDPVGISAAPDRVGQKQHAPKPVARGCSCGLASVIGLKRPHGHQDIGAVIQCISNQVFELARLVAATGKAGAVVPLDPDRGDLAIAAESQGEARHRFEWRRKHRKSDRVASVHSSKLQRRPRRRQRRHNTAKQIPFG